MGYTPITAEQAQKDAKEQKERFLPWPAGKYAFQVTISVDAGFTNPDKSGKRHPMTLLTLDVYNEAGNAKILKDYLPTGGQMAYRFRHAAIACGLQEEYEKGILAPYMFEQRRGDLYLTIAPKQAKKIKETGAIIPGEFWPEKNTVEDYITEGVAQRAAVVNTPVNLDLDDEIPF